MAAGIIGIGASAYGWTRSLWSVGFAAFFLTISRYRSWGALLAIFIAGSSYAACRRLPAPTYRWGEIQKVHGIVAAPPDPRTFQTFLTVAVLPFPAHGPPTRLLVKAPKSSRYKYGDELEVIGTLKRPERFSSTFDYPLYLERYGITGIVSSPKRVRTLSRGNGNPVVARLYSLQATLEQRTYAFLPKTEGALLNGILLGAKRSLPESLQEELRATGTSHIVVISGANITILITLILKLLPLYTRRQQYLATVLIALWMTVMTGASASVIRGAVVAFATVHIRHREFPVEPLALFLLMVVLMLLWNPLLVTADPSFQLSVTAFGGLLFLGRPVTVWVKRARLAKSLPEIMRSSLAETLAATLGTFPLSFYMFGRLSLLGLIVNPLVLWLLPAITFMGSLLILATPVPWFAKAVSMPLSFLLAKILAVIGWFGHLPFGVVTWQPNLATTFALYMVLILSVYRLKRRMPESTMISCN